MDDAQKEQTAPPIVLNPNPPAIQKPTTNQPTTSEPSDVLEIDEQVKNEFALTPKEIKFFNLFTDEKNKETYGNRTESAMQAFDCSSRAVAATIGSRLFRKVKGLASSFADQKGYTFEILMGRALTQATSTESPEWWDRVMDMLEYRDLKPTVQVQQNTQNNYYDLRSPEVEKVNKAIKEALMNS